MPHHFSEGSPRLTSWSKMLTAACSSNKHHERHVVDAIPYTTRNIVTTETAADATRDA
jgi:hypothetical protein